MTRFLMISSDCFKQKVIFSRHRFLKYWITSRQFCSKTDSFFSSPRFDAFEFAAVGISAKVCRTSMLKSGGTSVGSSWDTKTYKNVKLIYSYRMSHTCWLENQWIDEMGKLPWWDHELHLRLLVSSFQAALLQQQSAVGWNQ